MINQSNTFNSPHVVSFFLEAKAFRWVVFYLLSLILFANGCSTSQESRVGAKSNKNNLEAARRLRKEKQAQADSELDDSDGLERSPKFREPSRFSGLLRKDGKMSSDPFFTGG